MPSRPGAADSPPKKARVASNQRRRFSIYQRGQEVTVGPLGFDVPINGDKTAFPLDEIDEEDRLSGVEYPSPDDYESKAKRRRIEENARDYLCGRRLNLYSTTLRGPLEKSYWGQRAKVTGTSLEITARGLKKDIIREQHRKSEALASLCCPTTPPKVPVRKDKGQRVTLSQKLRSQQRNEEPSILDSQPSIGVGSTPATYPPSPLLAVKNVTPVAGKLAQLLPTTTDSARTTRVRSSRHSQQKPVVQGSSQRNQQDHSPLKPSQGSFIDLTEGGGASGLLLDDGTVFNSSYTSPLMRKSKTQTKSGDEGDILVQKGLEKLRSRSAETEASEFHSSQLKEHSTLNIDLDRLGQISKELGLDNSGLLDDTTNFFRNENRSRRKNDQSPATALKISLPKFDTKKNQEHRAPTSPTIDAALRKALKAPPIQRRRSDLGHTVSLGDMIARTAASSRTMSYPKQQPRGGRNSQDSSSDNVAPGLSLKSRKKDLSPSEEQHPGTTLGKQAPGRINVPSIEDSREEEGEGEDQDDMEMVPESPIEKSMSNEPMIEPPNTVTQPPMRLSQMPTPLPPSPLTLLHEQAVAKIPETVVEEVVERSPVGATVSNDEPAFNPGPRRPKRFAPKTARDRVMELKNSGEAVSQAALNSRKIATPISRLHQKMAEFSPISPIAAIHGISPIAESQPQLEIEKSSIRLQERLKEGQQNRSSQLSSPPPSSPPEARAPAVAIPQPEESSVEVPATSKEETAAELSDNLESVASGAPLSPPQEPQEPGESEEDLLALGSNRSQKITESSNNDDTEVLPIDLVEETISHISATHPGSSANIADLDESVPGTNFEEPQIENSSITTTERILESTPLVAIPPVSNDPIGTDLPDKIPERPSPEASAAPKTPPGDTQTSRISVPDSFKKAIAAPINYTFTTPAAPLPPSLLPGTTSFTPINPTRALSSPGSTKIISPASSRADFGTEPFSMNGNDVEFTPFRAVRSPEQAKKTRTPNSASHRDAIAFEGIEPISPFTFSQLMKPVESQYQVSPAKLTGVAALLAEEKPSSYDLENVLGGVEDFLMSDVYDVEEEARKLSENPSFGESGGDLNGPQKEISKRKNQKRC
ncbi:hypothetical protein TWF718_003705 [Orbilia javanica]|uniref:Uncharacterized protein n=1 Tax=Orbilia javanica TaxID=47235 RepID=A0AAN8RK52_9PEZI